MISATKSKRRLLAMLLSAICCLFPVGSLASGELFTALNTDIVPISLSSSGILASIPKVIGTADQINIDCSMTEEQWRNMICNSTSVQTISVNMELSLPNGTTWVSNIGMDRSVKDEEALSNLAASRRYQTNGYLTLPLAIDLADVSINGGTAIVTPIVRDGFSFAIAYGDGSNEYYHRINYKLVHGNTNAFQIANIFPDKNRITMNATALKDVQGEFDAGVIHYSILSKPASNISISTGVTRPDSAAIKANINKGGVLLRNSPFAVDDDGKVFVGHYCEIDTSNERYSLNTFSIEWLDGENNIIHTEALTLSSSPVYMGIWMDEDWSPVPAERFSVSDSLSIHFGYDDSNGCLMFNINPSNASDYASLCGLSKFYVAPPNGANYYKIVITESAQLYDQSYLSGGGSIAEQFAAEDFYAISDGDSPFYASDTSISAYLGRMCTQRALDDTDLTVLSVNETAKGYTDLVCHIQWYSIRDENSLIRPEDNKAGEYLYLTKNGYAAVSTTPVVTSLEMTVTSPTAVSTNVDYSLKVETPLQQETGMDDWYYLLSDLKYIDTDGNEVEPVNAVYVYLPYPSGINYNNASNYDLTLRHYTNDTYMTYTDVSLTPTEYGLRFETNDFSPFLLGWRANKTNNEPSHNVFEQPFTYPIQNTNIYATVGASAALTVSATGTAPILYQWQTNRGDGWMDIVGATEISYSTSNVVHANNGYQYRCIATNSYGTTISGVFTLQVIEAADIPQTGDGHSNIGWLMTGLPLAVLLASAAMKRKQQRK